jgi:hypothetical protein
MTLCSQGNWKSVRDVITEEQPEAWDIYNENHAKLMAGWSGLAVEMSMGRSGF